MFTWPVMPLCEAQLKDVRPEDVLNNGLYRKCNIYRGGGGYDKFPTIYKERTSHDLNPTQFVVQLKGCPLKCPYCYVTNKGVLGEEVPVPTRDILNAYEDSGLEVFHLMGGAPALYLEHWNELAYNVNVFHSDFLLIEKPYDKYILDDTPGLHAVSIKESKIYNSIQMDLFWSNLYLLFKSDLNWYFTFTGPCDDMKKRIVERYGEHSIDDSFDIEIKEYRALKGKIYEN
jgi:hypothetical protein